jgi:RNA polymerase sigma-70 factor (ECF subfamily)
MSVLSDPESDEALWTRSRAGDTVAFAVLFDRHADAVYTHGVRRTGSRTDAEDLTTMVFLAAWRKAGGVRFVDGSLKPWLLVVASNLARTQARSRRRYEHLVARLPRDDLEPDIADEAIRDVAAEQFSRQLAGCLALLRAAEQDVIALCDIEELSYADAARALGVPIGTVRSRLSRARRKLRPLLEQLELDDRAGATTGQQQGGSR